MGSSNKREASSPYGRQSSRSSDPNLASQEEGAIPSFPQRTRHASSSNRVFLLLARPHPPDGEAVQSVTWGVSPHSTLWCRYRFVTPDLGGVDVIEECYARTHVLRASNRGTVLVALAISGDALLPNLDAHRGVPPSARVRQSLESVFSIAHHHDLVVTHGHVAMNPPDPSPFAYDSEVPFTLDLASAQAQGVIGYYLAQAFAATLPLTHVVSVLTQTEVSAHDPAFLAPDVFVGPALAASTAHRLEVDRGWHIRTDGSVLRRVVPALDPVGICELQSIQQLVDVGTLVICAGNGGIPVLRDGDGQLNGVDAIVRREITASFLATALDADAFLLLGGEDYELSNGPKGEPIRRATPEELRAVPMGSAHTHATVEAAARYVETTGKCAMIGPLARAQDVFSESCGTLVHP